MLQEIPNQLLTKLCSGSAAKETTTCHCKTSNIGYFDVVASDLELLQSILVEITQAKRMDVVLPMIVSELVDNANFALA